MHHERILPSWIAIEHPHTHLTLRTRSRRQIRILKNGAASEQQIGALQDHAAPGLQNAGPLFEHVHHFPSPKVLDHVNGHHFVRTVVAERREFVEVANDVRLFARTTGGDVDVTRRGGRQVGVRITGLRLDGRRVDERVSFDEGFHPPDLPKREAGEEFARWSTRTGSVRIRAVEGEVPVVVSLRLSAPERCRVRLATDDAAQTVEVGPEPAWFEVTLPPGTFDVINNAGSELYRGGYGGDRGFLHRDRGQYDRPAEVFAWCGAAVLLRREYLDAVGHFDDRLFLYYEDTDLSWRGRLAGWRYLYEPAAVVRHRHSASSGEHSPVFIYHTQRNRLLVILKLAPWREVAGVFSAEGARFVRGLIADIAWRMVRLHPPALGNTRQRLRIYRGVASLAPAMLRDRRTMRCTVSRSAVVRRWEVTK